MSASDRTTMSWTKEDVFRLIDLMRRRPILYNSGDPSFHDTKSKLQVRQEIATIMSTTRHGTTVDDVMNKWSEICSKFILNHRRSARRRKCGPPLFYFDKMDFMSEHLISNSPIARTSEDSTNKENKDQMYKEMSENLSPNESPRERQEYCSDVNETAEMKNMFVRDANSETNVENRESISAISIHSDPPQTPDSVSIIPSKSYSRKRPSSAMTNAFMHDVSCVTLGSPLMSVGDSLLNRTFMNESTVAFANESYVSGNSSHENEDEDTMYVKYLVCKLRKLDETKKLKFKINIEKLFYENLKE